MACQALQLILHLCCFLLLSSQACVEFTSYITVPQSSSSMPSVLSCEQQENEPLVGEILRDLSLEKQIAVVSGGTRRNDAPNVELNWLVGWNSVVCRLRYNYRFHHSLMMITARLTTEALKTPSLLKSFKTGTDGGCALCPPLFSLRLREPSVLIACSSHSSSFYFPLFQPEQQNKRYIVHNGKPVQVSQRDL